MLVASTSTSASRHQYWCARMARRFVLVEGHHRLEATKALGKKTIIGFRVEARKH